MAPPDDASTLVACRVGGVHLTDIDVAVVGAGLAGLGAADRLARAGRRPVVFEATDRVGGRQRSTTLAGEVLEEGAVFFGRNYPRLRAALAATGLESELKRYDVRNMRQFPVGEHAANTTRGLLGSRSRLPVAEKLSLLLFGATMAPFAREIRDSLGGVVRSAPVRRLDTVNADDYLARRVGRRFVDWMASPFMEALGFAPARDWSALGAMQILAFAGMTELRGIASGNSRLAEALAQGHDVRRGGRVVRIAPFPAGVEFEVEAEADGATETHRCRDLVLAVPAPIARDLLRGALREAVGRFQYSSSLVIAAALTDLAVEMPCVSIFGGPDGYRHIGGMVAERSAPNAPVVSYAALRYPWQYELFDAADDELFPVLTDVLEEVHGGPIDVIDRRIVRWRHSVPVPAPGTLARRREASTFAREVPHLFLAGDWMVSPSQEGALVSGHNAAEALLTG